MSLRLCNCVPENVLSTDRNHDVNPSNEEVFKGPLGIGMSDLFEVLVGNSNVKNLSVVTSDSAWACIESMAKQETDITLAPTFYWKLSQLEGEVFPVIPFSMINLNIISGYNMTSLDSAIDDDIFLSGWSSLSVDVIILCLLVLIVVYGLLKLSLAFRKRKVRCLAFEVLAYFMQQDSLEFRKFIRRFLFLILSIASFFMLTFYCLVMSTELVSIPKPKIIKTFQDVIDRTELEVYDFKSIKASELFSEGDSEGKFFNKVKERLSLLDVADMDGAINSMKKLASSRGVLISPVFGDGKKALCAAFPMASSDMKTFKGYPYISPEGEGHFAVEAMSKTFLSTDLGKKIEVRMKRAFEGGFPEETPNRNVDMEKLFGVKYMDYPYYEKCVHHSIVMPEYEMTGSLSTIHLKSLFLVCTILLVITVYFLVLEMLYPHLKQFIKDEFSDP